MSDIENILKQEAEEIATLEAEEEEKLDFEAGFTGVEPVKPQSQPEPEPEPAPEPEPEPQPPEAKKPTYDELESRLRKTEGTLGELASRVRAMHKAGSEEAKKQRASIPDPSIVEQAADDPEKWKKLEEEFPDWAQGVAQYVDLTERRLANSIIKKDDIEKYVQDYFSEQTETVRNIVQEQLIEDKREVERAKLDRIFPEWNTELQSEPFNRWLRVQTDETLKLFESDSAEDYIKLLDLYKGKQPKQDPNLRLVGNIAPTTRSTVTQTPQPSEQDDFDEGFELGR